MTTFDPEKFMNEPIYAFDFSFMISSIRGFLEFSEANVESQYHEERQSIQQQSDSGGWGLSDEYHDSYLQHLLENAKHWFTIGLPLQIRYGALLSLITMVEWSVKGLAGQLKQSINEKEPGCNLTVHRLRGLAEQTKQEKADSINNYEALVEVRNCITHNAGLENKYRYPKGLEAALDQLEGFSLDNWHFFGKHVCIEHGALEPYIDEIKDTVVGLHKATHEQALLKST